MRSYQAWDARARPCGLAWYVNCDRRSTWQTLRKEQGNELYAAGDIDGAIQKYKESVEEYLPSECQIVSEEGHSYDQKEMQKREARRTAIAARLNLGMCYTRRAYQPMECPNVMAICDITVRWT